MLGGIRRLVVANIETQVALQARSLGGFFIFRQNFSKYQLTTQAIQYITVE
jgi:hypothetical protein